MSPEEIALEILKMHFRSIDDTTRVHIHHTVDAYNKILEGIYSGQKRIFDKNFDRDVEQILSKENT